MQVKKHSGELVPFQADSLKHSLRRSGANEKQVENVFTAIQAELYDGIPTRTLYELAFKLLKDNRNSLAARYSLKKALRDLGPEGYYFEKWIACLFADDGYTTTTSKTVVGHAVSHEIDVVAVKDSNMLAIECKFRNDIDAKISVTTPMYFMSRVQDISGKKYTFFNQQREFTDGWLVTNAYLTSDSKDFGRYYKLNLLAWDYPAERSIKVRVDDNGLYPITCLTTLSDQHKGVLLQQSCILVQHLVKDPQLLKAVKMSPEQQKAVLLEATELINSPVEVE